MWGSGVDLDTWKTVALPLGTVYDFPPRGDEQTSITGAPARTEVGAQKAIKGVSKFTQAVKSGRRLKWDENELETTLHA